MSSSKKEDLFPFTSSSELETRSLGHRFGIFLQAGDVVALVGDLGAGKTQFVKGVAEAFKFPPEDVSSPTFTIVHEYRGSAALYHMDLFRLKDETDLLQAGIEEYLTSGGISLIEWPQKAEHLLPAGTHIISITHQSEGKRLLEYVCLRTP